MKTAADYCAAIAAALHAYPEGWSSDLVARAGNEEGIATVGALWELEFFPYIEVDTDNYDEPAAAAPIANFIASCHPLAMRSILEEREQKEAAREQDAMAFRIKEEECERLRRDAERYRWLLANYARGDGYDLIDAALNDGEPETQLSPAIDAAIDAALKDPK